MSLDKLDGSSAIEGEGGTPFLKLRDKKCEGSSPIDETQHLRNKLKCRAKKGVKPEPCGAKKTRESEDMGIKLK